jgi:hypothetical protein
VTEQLRAQLEQLDWQAPWWQPWRELGQRVAERVVGGQTVAQALGHLPAPVSFVPQSVLPSGMAYEAFIYERRLVPTRNNLHDFFNGLAWLKYPQIKQRLNALQYAEIAAQGVQATRGRVRDALTVFDENAAFLNPATQAPLMTALKAQDWPAAFHTHRALWREPPLLFGHALLEKLVQPYKSITAHVFLGTYLKEELDANVAQALQPALLAGKPFAPLPVLGVPHWWAANESPDFYTDTKVFRSLRP